MDFFAAQDEARARSSRLVVLFGLAVAAIIVAVYAAVLLLAMGQGMNAHSPQLFAAVAGGTVLIVAIASTVRTAKLRRGGHVVAEMLGGVRVDPGTMDAAERRYVNVVEEMALASGVPVPGIYLLPESGINAFAAGYTVDDAVVGVTRGAIEQLSRDELQGVVAHEFSHILNGDMRLNIRLMGLLFGILVIAIIGRVMLRSSGSSRSRSRNNKSGGGMALFALALVAIGYIGVFFGRMIQAAVSRQREFLADAAAVQFTRDPDGIGGALRRIAGWKEGSRLDDAHAAEASHMFFASGLRKAWIGALATHPPIDERIRRIDPSFTGAVGTQPTSPARAGVAGLHGGAQPVHAMLDRVGSVQPQDLAAAQRVLQNIPVQLRDAAHDQAAAPALLFAILVHHAPAAGQREYIESFGGAELALRVDAQVSAVAALDASLHLPLLELLLPALRALPEPRRRALHDAAHSVALADGQATALEHAVLHLLQRQLAPAASAAAQARVQSVSPQQLGRAFERLLSAVAWAAADTDAQAAAAFAAGAASLRGVVPPLTLQPRGDDDAATSAAFRAVRSAKPALKRAFVEAAALTAAEDGEVQPRELQLLRAIGEAIEAPLPLSGVVAPAVPAA